MDSPPPQQLQLTGCNVTLPPGAENDAANRKPEERPAHVDANERPGIRFKSGEHRNGRVFHEHERKPASERDFETAPNACWVRPSDKQCERVVDDNRSDEREDVGADAMCSLDVGRGFGVKIQPSVAPNGVPAPANEKINNDENPDRDVIDSSVHYKRTRQDLPDFYETQIQKSC